MTNYNERLDKVLSDYTEAIGSYVNFGSPFNSDEDNIAGAEALYQTSHNEAKQAITSLIKELVAEALPEKPKHIEITEPIVGIDRLWQQGRDVGYASGQADAIDKFEQNLLKALEEV